MTSLYMPAFYFNYTSEVWFKCANTFINNFLWNFIPLINKGFFHRIEISCPLALVYVLLQESLDPKIYWIQT